MKIFKKIIASLLTVCVIAAGVAELSINSANAEIVSLYDWHLYMEGSNVAKMAIPKAYTVRNTIRTFESQVNAVFSTPTDMFIDDDDNIYVVDSGNARIVKMDSWGNMIYEVSAIECRHGEDEECDHVNSSSVLSKSGSFTSLFDFSSNFFSISRFEIETFDFNSFLSISPAF